MRVLIVTALITALVGGVCVGGALVAINRGELDGSGNVVSEQRAVSGISRVELEGPGRLVITQGEDEGLTITTDDNILDRIETEIEGERLAISFERSGLTTLSRIDPTDEILFELTVKSLTAIEIDGTADVEIAGFQGDSLAVAITGPGDAVLEGLRLDELSVAITGSSTIDVAGTVDRQTVTIEGAGNYRAANLASRAASVTVDGDGEATVRVRETLTVEIDDSGSVEYIGSPQVTETISDDGVLIPLDEGVGTPDASPRASPVASPAARATSTPRSLNPLRATATPTPD